MIDRRRCLHPVADVDEAVKSKDPTGGRGFNGHIREQLEATRVPEHEALGAVV